LSDHTPIVAQFEITNSRLNFRKSHNIEFVYLKNEIVKDFDKKFNLQCKNLTHINYKNIDNVINSLDNFIKYNRVTKKN